MYQIKYFESNTGNKDLLIQINEFLTNDDIVYRDIKIYHYDGGSVGAYLVYYMVI
jgi:hypothetical protein